MKSSNMPYLQSFDNPRCSSPQCRYLDSKYGLVSGILLARIGKDYDATVLES